MKGHFRHSENQDYSIRVEDQGGSFYIKPKDDKLVITAHPNIEHLLYPLLGEPQRRESPDSMDYAYWEILK